MGSYSEFRYDDIEIIDHKGLVLFIKRWNKMNNQFKLNNFYDTKFKTLDFSIFNDHKIIQYWYPEFVVFIKCLAKYIEGMAEFICTDYDEVARINFKNNKVSVYRGIRKWYNSWNVIETLEEEILPNELKNILLIEDI